MRPYQRALRALPAVLATAILLSGAGADCFGWPVSRSP